MRPVFILLALSVCFVSCKKEEAAKTSNTELISKKSWKLIALTQTLSTGEVQDMYAPMSTCYRDDEFIYRSNLSFEANAGVIKCVGTDPQIFASGTWKFINSETAVERTTTSGLGIGTTVYSVITLTETTMKLRATDGGIAYNLSFSH
jgi:hypothetical protein